MPAFNPNLSFPYTALQVGESYALWNIEPTISGANSVVICRAPAVDSTTGITFQYNFSATPNGSLVFYGSNVAPTAAGPQNGIILQTYTNTQAGSFTDTNFFAFYWCVYTGTTGPTLLVLAQR